MKPKPRRAPAPIIPLPDLRVDDPRFPNVRAWCLGSRRPIGPSALMREFRVSYSSGAALLEALEAEGLLLRLPDGTFAAFVGTEERARKPWPGELVKEAEVKDPGPRKSVELPVVRLRFQRSKRLKPKPLRPPRPPRAPRPEPRGRRRERIAAALAVERARVQEAADRARVRGVSRDAARRHVAEGHRGAVWGCARCQRRHTPDVMP